MEDERKGGLVDLKSKLTTLNYKLTTLNSLVELRSPSSVHNYVGLVVLFPVRPRKG